MEYYSPDTGTRAPRSRTLFSKVNRLLLSVTAAICIIGLMEMYTSHRVAVETLRIQQFYVPNVLRSTGMSDALERIQTNLLEYSLGSAQAENDYFNNLKKYWEIRQHISEEMGFEGPLAHVDGLVHQIHERVEAEVLSVYSPNVEKAALRDILKLQKSVGIPLLNLLRARKYELIDDSFNPLAVSTLSPDAQSQNVRLYMEMFDTVSRLMADLDRFVLKDDTAQLAFLQNTHTFSFLEIQLQQLAPGETRSPTQVRIAELITQLERGGDRVFKRYSLSRRSDALEIIDTLQLTLLLEATETLHEISQTLRKEATDKLSVVRELIYLANFMMLACIALALVLLMYTIFFIRRRLISPVGSITRIISKLRKGERNMVIASSSINDEMGEVMNALHQFQAELYELDALRNRQIEQYRQLEKRERQLQSKSADLEDANRGLEQFVYIASHDLREPLKQISGFAELLEIQAEPFLDAESKDSLTRIQTYAMRMCNLIDDLRSLTKINRHALTEESCDLNLLLESELGKQSIALDEHGVEIEVGFLPTITCDACLMEEVFRQLIHNALQHGEAPLRIKIDSLLVDEGKESTMAAIRFTNPGGNPGITPERLMLPFVRGPNRHGSGTGMGLAIVKKIVDSHAGKLEINTKEGWFTACIKLHLQSETQRAVSTSLPPLKKSA